MGPTTRLARPLFLHHGLRGFRRAVARFASGVGSHHNSSCALLGNFCSASFGILLIRPPNSPEVSTSTTSSVSRMRFSLCKASCGSTIASASYFAPDARRFRSGSVADACSRAAMPARRSGSSPRRRTRRHRQLASRFRQVNVCGSNTTISRRPGKCNFTAAMGLRQRS
jgi:hypothetical protein